MANPAYRNLQTYRLAVASGESRENAGSAARALRAAAIAALMSGFLAACSTAPDWARPSIIYGDEETAEAAAVDAPADSEFPKLNEVPDRPAQTSTAQERQQMANNLAADRERSRYTDEVLRGGTEPPAPAPVVAEPAPLPSIPETSGSGSDGAVEAAADEVVPMPERGGRSSLSAPAKEAEEAVEAAEPPAPPAVPGGDMEPMAAPGVQSAPVGDITAPRREPTPVPDEPIEMKEEEEQSSYSAPGAAATAAASKEADSTPVEIPASPEYDVRRAAAQEPPAVQQQAAQPQPQPQSQPAYSSTRFERSSAPQLSREALDEAGGVVSGRYQQTHETVVIGGEKEPDVQINMDALDMYPAPGPGAALDLDTQVINGDGMLSAVGGPSQAPFSVYFGHGKTGLTEEDRSNLAEVKSALDAYGSQLRVVGHASSRTADLALPQHKMANFDVSMRRAEAVAAELTRQGIDPARIIVEARGEAEPVYYEAMPAGEAGNRRVEIYVE